ncbi:hypothetical protein KJ797_01295, partial [Patescibacteria group bacterium]|nr:hypothetical protein [Patescibacteria group bacterium]
GDDSIGAWGANYCKADDSLYHSRVVHQRGCAGSACYDNASTEEELVETCDDSNPATIDTCVSGSCVYNISNTPPTVAISCDPVDCQQYYGFVLVLMNDSSDPDGDRDIIKTKWYKKNQGAPDTDYQEIIYCQSNAKTNCTPQLDIGIGAYTAKLYVEDSMAQSSTAVKNFIIKQDAVANFECSLDSKSWNDCASITISQGQVIYLQDKSTASEGANITSRTWQINNADFNTGNNTTVSVKVNQPNNNIITLIIKDSKNRSNSKNKTIKTQLPLPTYREVAP